MLLLSVKANEEWYQNEQKFGQAKAQLLLDSATHAVLALYC